MNAVERRIEAAIYAPATGRRLWYVHVAMATLLVVRIAVSPYREYALQPAELFRPVWFLSFMDAMPSAAAIGLVQLVAVGAGLAFIASRLWPSVLPVPLARTAYVVLWCAYLFLTALRASNGKVMHNDLSALWCAFFLCFAPLDAARTDRAPSRRFGWPINASVAFVACAYFFAGWWKLWRSGPSWIFSDNVRLSIAWGPDPEVAQWPWLADVVTSVAAFGVILAIVTIVFELSAPVMLFVPRLRPALGALAIAMHVGVYLLFGLDYWMWIAVDAVVLFDPTRGPAARAPVPVAQALRVEPPG